MKKALQNRSECNTFLKSSNNKASTNLKSLLAQRILLIDGAMGTALETLKPAAADFGGEQYFGCNEMLCLHAPHLVLEVHRTYLEAGADIIETNSFNGSPVVLKEYGLSASVELIAKRSAELAREAVRKWASDRPAFVMGAMGPGTKSISVTGGITFDEVYETYRIYARGLLKGGVDVLLLETVQDTLNLKAALLGIQATQLELGSSVPIAVSVTIETGGTMLAGQNIEALYHTMSGFNLAFIGINCATGPEFMTDHLRTLSSLSRFPVSVMPNAGMPDHEGNYSDDPSLFENVIGRLAREGFVNLVGGCCGTTPDHIRALKRAVEGVKPRKPVSNGHYPALTGSEAMVVESDNRPVFVGERTNTIGSRKFKRLINQNKWNEAAEIGRTQVQKGAMVLDVCTADPERDEKADMVKLLKPLLRKVRAPVMLDTIDPDVIEASLKVIGGKPAVNSVNLEDGGIRLRKVASLARQYGASVICGMIDDNPENGMAITTSRKLAIAKRIYRILKDEFYFPDTDIILDPLVFPVATGDAKYVGSAKATIDAIRLFKQHFPDCPTILGISNVSFGLPSAGREIVNSVFLYLCAKAGLDIAIVNTERLRRYPTIPDRDRSLAKKLLLQGDSNSVKEFTERYRNAKPDEVRDDWKDMSVADRIRRAVIDARHEGLKSYLDELLERLTPLEIINGPLVSGMDEVGRLFNDNRLIVAEVLESAEVMKTAVDHLRSTMSPGESTAVKGRMLLATVKGDVHDIGKNLVEMIMSNNGYEIINLGIKVSPEVIIAGIEEHKPDLIGLSGLLVRSAQQMVHTAHDLTAADIKLPLLVGGAALTNRFTKEKIAPAYKGEVCYASNAMEGLSIANRIVGVKKNGDNAATDTLPPCYCRGGNKGGVDNNYQQDHPPLTTPCNSKGGGILIPTPPDFNEHIDRIIPLEDVLNYLDRKAFFTNFLGMKQAVKRLTDPNDDKVSYYDEQISEAIKLGRDAGVLQPRCIYRWCRAYPEDEAISLEIPGISKRFRFRFPRSGKNGESAADWLKTTESGGDSIGVFVVTSGEDTAELAANLRAEGELLKSHILQALALSTTEAAAEYVHHRMRIEWGIPDPTEFTLQDILRAKYRGARLSLGYPSCPYLEEQAVLFELLKPERIGITLSESYMMHPESSVSAFVFHSR